MTVIDRDTGYNKFLRDMKDLEGEPGVLVGIRQEKGSQVPEGSDATLAEYATYNEFGTQDGRVPERSFLRSTMDENQSPYADELQVAVENVVDGRASINTGLKKLGVRAVGDVKKKIGSGVPPANAPSTVARKKSSKTLIDKGRMRQSIEYEVEGV